MSTPTDMIPTPGSGPGGKEILSSIDQPTSLAQQSPAPGATTVSQQPITPGAAEGVTAGAANLAPNANQIKQPTQPETTASGLQKHADSFAVRTLKGIFSAFGGPKTEAQYGPHGEVLPEKTLTTGQRVRTGIGTFLEGMSAGLGQHGPGSAGRSAALAAQATSGILDRRQQYGLEVARQHMSTYNAWHAQNVQEEQTMQSGVDKGTKFLSTFENSPYFEKVASGTATPYSDGKDWAKSHPGINPSQHMTGIPDGVAHNPKSPTDPLGEKTHLTYSVYSLKDPKMDMGVTTPVTDPKVAAMFSIEPNDEMPAMNVIKAHGLEQSDHTLVKRMGDLYTGLGMKAPNFNENKQFKFNNTEDRALLQAEEKLSNLWSDGKIETFAGVISKLNTTEQQPILDRFFGGSMTNVKNMAMQAAEDAKKQANKDAVEREVALDPNKAKPTDVQVGNMSKDISSLPMLSRHPEMVKGIADRLKNSGTVNDMNKEWDKYVAINEQMQKAHDSEMERKMTELEPGVMTAEMQEKINHMPPDQHAMLSKYDPTIQSALYQTAFGDGDVDFEKVFPTRVTGKSGQIDQQHAFGVITNLNPNWTVNSYAVKRQTYLEYANLEKNKPGGQIMSANNIIGHVANEQDAANALYNRLGASSKDPKDQSRGLRVWNQAVNTIDLQTGGTELQNLLQTANVVNHELQVFIDGGGKPTEEEMRAQEALNNPMKSTPAQINQACKSIVDTMGVRLEDLNEGYKTSTGHDFPNLIYPSRTDQALQLGMAKRFPTLKTGGRVAASQATPNATVQPGNQLGTTKTTTPLVIPGVKSAHVLNR